MPIIMPKDLPATEIFENENVFVMNELERYIRTSGR